MRCRQAPQPGGPAGGPGCDAVASSLLRDRTRGNEESVQLDLRPHGGVLGSAFPLFFGAESFVTLPAFAFGSRAEFERLDDRAGSPEMVHQAVLLADCGHFDGDVSALPVEEDETHLQWGADCVMEI